MSAASVDLCVWGEERAFGELRARGLRLQANGRTVPAMLWRAADADDRARPLVLVQHGGSGHKADDAVLQQVQLLVGDGGFLAATIDGPIHGERVASPAAGEQMRNRFLDQWRTDPMIDTMVQDWQAVLDKLCELPQVDAQRIGWMGTSMGTAYGLPFVAACPQVKAAVLGKWSGDYANSERLMRDAPAVLCPVLFIQHWHDELFSRDGTLALFDRIGASDKRLHLFTGSHFQRGGEPLIDAVAHLRRYLHSGAE